MTVVATIQQRQQVLKAIDEAEASMLTEAQRLELDLLYNDMKFSGELQRLEQARAFREELRWQNS